MKKQGKVEKKENVEGFDYEIDYWSAYNYKLDILLKVSNRFFKMIFEKSLPKLEKKNIGVRNSYDEVREFAAPPMYHKIVAGYMKKPFDGVKDDCKKIDKRLLKVGDVKDIRYLRKGDVWYIKTIIEGNYEEVSK